PMPGHVGRAVPAAYAAPRSVPGPVEEEKRERKRMSSKLFVGGLSWNTDDEMLRQAFEPHGTVTQASVIMDRDTDRSRGFGFVTMESPDQAQAAMKAMNMTTLDGRTIKVDIAREREGGGGGGGR